MTQRRYMQDGEPVIKGGGEPWVWPDGTPVRVDPTYGRIDPDIQQAVEDLNPPGIGERVAWENTLQARRDEANWQATRDDAYALAQRLTFWQGVNLGAAQGNTLGGAGMAVYGLVAQLWLVVAFGVFALAAGLAMWRSYGWRLHA